MSVIFWEQGFSDGFILYNAQLWFFCVPNHQAAGSTTPGFTWALACVSLPTVTQSAEGSTSTVATNTWARRPHLPVSACSLITRRQLNRQPWSQNNNNKMVCFEGCVLTFFLNFVQKSPVGRKYCISRYVWLWRCTSDITPHSLFVAQMPKLVISLTDNRTARNSSLGTETSLESPAHMTNT